MRVPDWGGVETPILGCQCGAGWKATYVRAHGELFTIGGLHDDEDRGKVVACPECSVCPDCGEAVA